MKKRKAKKGYTGPRVTDTETFILKSKWQHGDFYDYTRSVYVNAATKIEVVCRKHGSFFVTPSNHASNAVGCRDCKADVTKKIFTKTFGDFIERSREIHGSKYDYGEVYYVDRKTPVTIICPLHGRFIQKPMNHINSSSGCQKCSGMNHVRSNTEDFIEKSKLVHGDVYNYDKVDYVHVREPVVITCKTHGDFYQKPVNHLNGRGCKECSIISRANHFRSNLGKFIKKANKIHGSKYSYEKSVYVDSKTELEIICSLHGSFWKTPNLHLNQSVGCPDCSILEKGWGRSGYYGTEKESNIYLLKLGDDSGVKCLKIGLSKNVQSRVRNIEKESGLTAEVIFCREGVAKDLFEVEQNILYREGIKRIDIGVDFKGRGECFEEKYQDTIIKKLEHHLRGI